MVQVGDLGLPEQAFAVQRRAMVDGQIRTFDVTDGHVIRAFDSVPREAFLTPDLRPFAYSDATLKLTAEEPSRSVRVLLRPMHLARMMQGAAVAPDDRVLVVAGETGYTACLLSGMARSVVSLEADPWFTAQARANLRRGEGRNVAAETGSLAEGLPSAAPYDLIFVNGAVETNIDALLDQLAPTGRLVAIEGSSDGSRRVGRAVRLSTYGGDVSSRALFDATSPIIPDFRSSPTFVF